MALGRKSFYKSPSDLRAMVLPSEINARALRTVAQEIRAGVTTLELNALAETVIRDAGAEPNFAQVPGYRHSICANVNDTVVHGIPNDTPLQPGDMVTIDCGAVIGGWHSDAAICVVIPDPSRPELVAAREALSEATEEAMWVGVAALTRVKYLNEVGTKIEKYIRDNTKYG
ncbi:MAG: M24 family metallopeptidase, partial [Microbacteriaceae bacterium]